MSIFGMTNLQTQPYQVMSCKWPFLPVVELLAQFIFSSPNPKVTGKNHGAKAEVGFWTPDKAFLLSLASGCLSSSCGVFVALPFF